MSFWKTIYVRWGREEISSWNSMKKTAYILLPLLIYFLVHDAAELILWMLLNQFMAVCGPGTLAFISQNGDTFRGLINGAAVSAGFLSIWQAVRREICGVLPKTRDVPGDKILTGYMLLAALAFCAALGFNFLFVLLGITERSRTFTDTANAQFGVAFLVGIFLYGILSPVAEEAVFRGLMYNRMKRCFNYPIALLVSSLLFGCYHGNIVQALYGTFLGLLMAYTYESYGSFAAPVLFHGVANISIYVMTWHNRLSSIGREAAAVIAAVSLAGMGICLYLIRKRTVSGAAKSE